MDRDLEIKILQKIGKKIEEVITGLSLAQEHMRESDLRGIADQFIGELKDALSNSCISILQTEEEIAEEDSEREHIDRERRIYFSNQL